MYHPMIQHLPGTHEAPVMFLSFFSLSFPLPLFSLYNFIYCVCMCFMLMFVYYVCVCLVAMEARRGPWSPRDWSYSCKPSSGCWESNLGPLQEQRVIFTAELVPAGNTFSFFLESHC